MAEAFERGEFSTVAGKSGAELAYEVLERSGVPHGRIRARYSADRSEEYWTGWALAWYQWRTALPFRDIVRGVPIEDILALYHPYHEMDIRQFGDKMDELYRKARPDTRPG